MRCLSSSIDSPVQMTLAERAELVAVPLPLVQIEHEEIAIRAGRLLRMPLVAIGARRSRNRAACEIGTSVLSGAEMVAAAESQDADRQEPDDDPVVALFAGCLHEMFSDCDGRRALMTRQVDSSQSEMRYTVGATVCSRGTAAPTGTDGGIDR